jgi:hypothetical protein
MSTQEGGGGIRTSDFCLLLIVEDLTGLGIVVFTFALESFPRKNIGVVLVGLLDLFFCIVENYH